MVTIINETIFKTLIKSSYQFIANLKAYSNPTPFNIKLHQDSFEGSKAFFSENPAFQWDIKNYFKLTHSHLNKTKKYSNIINDYVHDLERLSNIEGLPNEVKVYVLHLKNEEKVDTHTRKFIVA